MSTTQVPFYFPNSYSHFKTPSIRVRVSRTFTQTPKTTSQLLHGQNLQIRRQSPASTTTHAHRGTLPRPQPEEQPEQSRGSPAPNEAGHSKQGPHQESPHSLRQQSSISSSPIPPGPLSDNITRQRDANTETCYKLKPGVEARHPQDARSQSETDNDKPDAQQPQPTPKSNRDTALTLN